MKQQWRIPDFLDLEYFFLLDRQLAEEEGEGVLRDRDRSMYLDEIGLDAEVTESDHEWLLYRWLQFRRSRENESQGGQALLPGRMWYELYGLFWSVFSFIALFAGGGLAYSFLAYSGKQPVNVTSFFLFFVVFQVLFLFLLLAAVLYRRISGLDLRSSLLLSLVNKGLTRFLLRVRKYGMDTLKSRRREQFMAALAAAHARGKGYGSLFFWPLFLLFQLFGIAFNCGVLGAVLVKVASSDLAFGWQSTIQWSAQLVAKLVQWLALPWSWLLGNTSYPDAGQVAGSRMVFKDGFYHLASSDLVSWWPFLCLSVCCYCLLPRIVLFAAGIIGRNRTLAAISFRRADHKQLLHRLLTPRLKTTPVPEERKTPSGIPAAPVMAPLRQPAAQDEEVVIPSEPTQAPVHGKIVVLVPDELFDAVESAELGAFCEQAFGYEVTQLLRISEEYSDAEMISERLQQAGLAGLSLVILQEAWQPPIQEMLSFLRDLRKNSADGLHIILALIGKPQPDTIFTTVNDLDLQIWKEKTAILADPCLQVSPLREKS